MQELCLSGNDEEVNSISVARLKRRLVDKINLMIFHKNRQMVRLMIILEKLDKLEKTKSSE